MKGIVKSYHARRGLGEIRIDSGDDTIFIHVSEIERAGLAQISPGDRVSFDVKTDRALNRRFAVNLALL